MNNKTLFKKAHKQARKTVDQVGNYQIAFTLALKELRDQPSVAQKAYAVVNTLPTVLLFTLVVLMLLGMASFPFIGVGAPFALKAIGYGFFAVTALVCFEFTKLTIDDYQTNLRGF